MRILLCLLLLALVPSPSRACLYYSAEKIAELPGRWGGFLLDQRTLRNIAASPRPGQPANPARQAYQKEADRQARQPALTPDQLADLGALYIRLGDPARALDILRRADRQHPNHFRITANLGTAWQLQGDLAQAVSYLQKSVRLAPPDLVGVEQYHLRLVRGRLAKKTPAGLDDLFGTSYLSDDGTYRPGDPALARRLPTDAVAMAQRLALTLPADARLLWQLAELAGAYGDLRAAANIMDGCVTELGLQDPELRRRRRIMRAAADAQTADSLRSAHSAHRALLKIRSRRPLLTRPDIDAVPLIRADGVNPLRWSFLGDTILGGRAGPRFPGHLAALDGKQVSLTGFLQPLNDDGSLLLVEAPVGCWYCETPDLTGMVQVTLSGGSSPPTTRSQVRVTGRLHLNRTDPERFLYTITNASIAETD